MSEASDAKGDVVRLLYPTGGVVSLVGDDPTRILATISHRALVMQRCHCDVSCHLGTWRTLRVLSSISLADWGGYVRSSVNLALFRMPGA